MNPPKFPRDEIYVTLTVILRKKKKRNEMSAAWCAHMSVTAVDWSVMADIAGGASGKRFLHPV